MGNLLEEIKNNVKISDVLSTRYNRRIDCPVCNRYKTASVINNEFVYCFSASCGFKADVIALNSYLLYGVTDKYKESMLDLANRFNIKSFVNEEDINRFEFYKNVNNIYINEFIDTSYLINRNITIETIKSIGIGYASGTSLRSHFNRSNLIKYGLFKDNKEFFINRVIFPLISYKGDIQSFIGRYIGPPNDFIPRYKNLQTSINTLVLEQYLDLYNKDKLLCVAEGFIDTISLYQLGLQSVGILGVQGLLNHASVLKDFKHICFCFDSDKDEENNYKSYKQLIPQIIDLILLNPLTKYYIYLPKEAKDINELLCKSLISNIDVEINKKPFIDFLLELYKEDYSKHIYIIKLIEVTQDNINKQRMWDIVGKESYNYAVKILDFYDRRNY